MDKGFILNAVLGVYFVSVWILSWFISYYDVKIQSWVELKKEATMEDFLVRGTRFFSFSEYKLNELPPQIYRYAKKHSRLSRALRMLTAAILIFVLCILFSLA